MPVGYTHGLVLWDHAPHAPHPSHLSVPPRMSFLFATLIFVLVSSLPAPLWAAQSATASSASPPSNAPDTTQSDTQPTLRECGLKIQSLQEPYYQAYNMDDSPERRARLREIEATIREVQTCYGERRPRVVMSTYRALVTAQFESGQPDASLRSYEEFFNRYPSDSDSSMVSWMYSNRGRHHFLLGHPSRSLRDYARSVEGTPRSAVDLRMQRMNNLALTYAQLREWDTAAHYLRRVIQLADRIASPSDPVLVEHGRALALQASLIRRRIEENGADDAVLAQLEDVSERAFEMLRPRSPDIAVGPLLTLADGYLAGRRPDQAAATIQRAAERVTEETSLNRRIELTRAQAQLALQRDRPDEARQLFNTVRQLAADGALIGQQRQAYTSSGQMNEEAGRLSTAQRHYETATALANAENESIRATLWSMRTFSDQRHGYDGLMRILRQQEKDAEAFEVWSQSRGRFLRDTRLQAALLNEMSAEVRLQYDSLTTRLNDVRTRRAAATDTANASSGSQVEQEAVLIAQRNELVDLSAYVPSLPQADLQRWLRDTDRTLIAYHVDTPNAQAPTQETVSAYVVRPDTIVSVTLPHTPQSLQALVKRISPLLADDTTSASLNTSTFDLNVLHEAYETLVAPLHSYLSDTGGLVIAADGPLFQLPFSALVTEAPPSRHAYSSARYLVETRPVLSTLSPALLVEDATAPSRATSFDVAAFGISEFGGTAPPDNLLASEIRLRSGANTLSLPDLPGVSTELNRLQHMFADTHLALNNEATPHAVRTHSPNATVVHLASHALLSPTDPLNSAFVLASDERSDGLLRVHDIMQPSAHVPLVVLSGCSTARGELRSGEGLLGLQYAFQASGARSTLSHLWPTDDATAVALSTSFYEHLRSGLPKDVALQQAQRAFMQAHPEQQSPFFWASPVLFGAPDALSLAPAHSLWARAGWVALGFGSIVALLLIVRRYRITAG